MKKIIICLLFIWYSTGFICLCYAQTVVYNTKTQKYHQLKCRWAAKCSANCIKIEKKEAIKIGGIPCKVCGG